MTHPEVKTETAIVVQSAKASKTHLVLEMFIYPV